MSYIPSALPPASNEHVRRRGAPFVLAAVFLVTLASLTLVHSGGARAEESGSATASADSSQAGTATDYDTWSAVAVAVSADLDGALEQYRSGNTAGAAATFQKAYSTDYVASNLGRVVQDNLGQDTSTSQQRSFADLRTRAYKVGDDALAADAASLKSSVADSAASLDATSSLASPRDYAAAQADAVATQRAEIQANSQEVNEGRQGRTWTEVADEMTPLIDQGVDKAGNGDGQGGAELVNKAYYGYYEKLGFEKTVMSAISGDRVSVVENQFKVVRKAMVSGASASEVRSAADTLISYIQEDAATLDGGAAQSISPIKAFFTGSFGQALIILLREGLEAILVVAAIIAYLIKAGMKDRVKHIYAGIVLGLVGSGIVAVLFAFLYNSASAHQEILEGVVALVAMGMLLFTSNWMLSKSSVESWNRYIKDRTEASISDGGFWALASLSFLAVFREGAETVMFYEALFTMDPGGKASIWQGFAVGVVLLVAIFLLIRFTSVKIPLRPFFAVTSFLMAVLVVIFAGGGAHALYEGDLIPGTYVPGWPTYDYLGIYPYKQTLSFQAFMLLVVIVLSVASVLHRRRRAAVAAAADAGSDDVKSSVAGSDDVKPSDDSSAIESDASDDAAAAESADAVAGSDAESADDAESAPKSTTE